MKIIQKQELQFIIPQVEKMVGFAFFFSFFLLKSSVHHAFTILHSHQKMQSSSFRFDDKNNIGRSNSYLSIQTDSGMELDMTGNGDDDNDKEIMSVTSYMKYVGPYACLALRFPELSTQSQKDRNVTGISLDFVLDTAANTNTINAQVAKELGLEVVGQALPGVGAGGGIGGGDTFSLGDCSLEDQISDDNDEPTMDKNHVFMSGLTASALPVASPAAAGLLGCYFFNAFEGGVEFEWGGMIEATKNSNDENQENNAIIPPSITFYGEQLNHIQLNGKGYVAEQPIPVTTLKDSHLPSVMLTVNGVQIPALLDTGSPITVINAAAAKIAGVETSVVNEKKEKKNGFMNPLAQLRDNYQMTQAMAQGDIVSLAGTDGSRIDLIRSKTEQKICLSSTTSFKPQKIYVGDIPGLEALDGLKKVDDEVRPAAILGMDILRSKPKMLYRKNELHFSEDK